MIFTFRSKLALMTPYDVVIAMVESLQDPYLAVKMDLHPYGGLIDGVMTGSAATLITRWITGVAFTPENGATAILRAAAIDCEEFFYYEFEMAIYSLSVGDIASYNQVAARFGFATLSLEGFPEPLPRLEDGYSAEDLAVYERFAAHQNRMTA